MTAETGDVTWSEPEDDGGAPVSGYVIERRDVTQDEWVESAQTEELCATLTQLVENHEYLFRVFAKNQYGLSEPATLQDPVTAKNPYSTSIERVPTIYLH